MQVFNNWEFAASSRTPSPPKVAAGAQPDTAKAHLAADDGLLQRCFNATSTAEGVVAELKAAKTEARIADVGGWF